MYENLLVSRFLEFPITLSLAAEPDILSNPTDIVLLLDRSRSMAGSPLANLKTGAKRFIQIIDEATDEAQDGHIGGGSRIGIVSFAGTATADTQLITSVAELNKAVEEHTTAQYTNHTAAFEKALQLFDPQSDNKKVIVMFTDGVTTIGGDASPTAASARAQGIVIYCIGLSGNGGLDEDALKDWASEPDSAYVSITPDDEELDKLFEDLARNITKPGARDIRITDYIAPCFRVVSLTAPTKGKASNPSPTTVLWKIDELGTKKSEGAALTFTVEHIGPCTGTVEVNEDVDYIDADESVVEFPSPYITVDCGTDVFPEECPEPVEVEIDGCEDAVEYDAGDLGTR